MSRSQTHQTYDQAVVIGSGISGLTAAHILAEYFAAVTVIDRDFLPEQANFRPGVPQALHAHTLLSYGQLLLEQQFPHLVDELLEKGAQAINEDTETAYFQEGTWHKPSLPAARASVSCSRPLLEASLYQRVTAAPQIQILQGYEVNRLLSDDKNQYVTGVVVRQRGTPAGETLTLRASLVVDASGRSSKAPEWLQALGFEPPDEIQIDSHAGYASRIYRKPAGGPAAWKKLYVSPRPPDKTRGGVIVPLEGGRWHVTLIGVDGDYPPTDEAGFLEFARSLAAPEFYEAIRDAEPVGRISGYRRNQNRVRRYECLPRYLEGFLVMGDAVFSMNPMYALGMTAAAASSQVLHTILQHHPGGNITGLAEKFQIELARSITGLWQQAVENEWQWPSTEIVDNTEDVYRRILA